MSNSVHRVNLFGGISGWLFSTPKMALEKSLIKIGQQNEEVVFILPDSTNIAQSFLYFVILVLTIFIWCPASGYLVVTKPK